MWAKTHLQQIWTYEDCTLGRCGSRLGCCTYQCGSASHACCHAARSKTHSWSKHPSHGFSLFLEQQAICMKLLKVDNRLSPRCPSPETFFESVA
ncbi:hypothetical protein WJX77_000773 [Trebouxia sp. C0004]